MTESRENYQTILKHLRDNQRDYFKALNLDFYFLDGKELSLRNIEHALCAFYKYHHIKRGGRIRRKYRRVKQLKLLKK